MEANPAGYIELQPFPQEKIENFLLNVVKEFKRRIETINTNQEITSLMITLDNQFLLVGTSEGLIMVYNPRTFENYPFQGHKGRVNCMANLDHNMIASAGEDKTIILWDLVNKTNLGSLSDSQSSILCLASSLKYNIIISGGLEDVIRICDVTKMQTIEELRYHKGYIKGIVFAKNDDLFISTGSDMKILIWNTERREVYKELQQESKITNLSYCHYIENLANLETIQRSVLVTSGEDKIIRLWDIETGERKLLPKHKSQIISMCPIQNSQYLITGSSKSVIYLWDVVKAKYETEFKLASLPKFLHCSPDGKFLYSAGNDKNLRKVRLVEDIERKDAVITHDDPYNKGENNINATAITPDSRFIYTIADDHILKKNDMIQSTSLELKVYEGPPKCMSINKAGN